jgi:diaminohydroxyphosphoribosylaminopyrimidine deaminase / 5-amino-6-(5-phosphoribosylamino)uracil reductase
MVGSGTQQADDPQLAVRDAEVTRQPLRIVVDSNARTPQPRASWMTRRPL